MTAQRSSPSRPGVRGVRAAPVSDPYSAERAIKSNNAKVLCLGALVVGSEVAKLLVDHWVDGDFAGGNSGRKVAKIEAIGQSRGPTTEGWPASPTLGEVAQRERSYDRW